MVKMQENFVTPEIAKEIEAAVIKSISDTKVIQIDEDKDSIEFTIDPKGNERLSRVKVYGNSDDEGTEEFTTRAQEVFNSAKLKFNS